MEYIQDVLKKAKEEGKIDARMLPWDTSITDTSRDEITRKEEITNYEFQAEPIKFPEQLCNDVQRIIENIRIQAKDKKLQVIGIVSAAPNEGTSTLAATISLMMASKQNGDEVSNHLQNKKKNSRNSGGILLIDAQLRNPSLHRIFAQPLKPGLTELLLDESSMNTFMKSQSNFDLKILTTGETKTAHSPQLNTEKFRSLLESVKQQVEFVFMDIPPLLPFAEGIALSKLCDGVILVVRAGQTRWEVVEEAKRLLENAEVNVLGAVLNRREYFIPEGVYRRL